MRKIFLLATAMLCAQLLSARQRPNIVFILADDLGYGDVSVNGQTRFTTPHIDQLAAEGMRFTQFYAGTSVCAPSRASLMTGLHTGHTFIRGNKEIAPEGQQPIADSVLTVLEVLQQAGYTTGVFGKWALGPAGSEGDPLKQGVSEFYGYICQRQAHRYYPTHLWQNDTMEELPGNAALSATGTYSPDLIHAQALSFMQAHRDQPFAMFLTYTLPHAELLVPDDSIFQRFKGRYPEHPYKGNDYGKGATVAGYTSQAYPHATFAAMVARLDLFVGQVMDQLKALGLDKNTIVIFSSDNGPHVEGGADPAFFHSAGPFRGVKRDLYEGGIREPFFVRWPGHVAAHSQSDFVGGFWDVMPTLAQLAGAAPPAHTDGISFVPALLQKGKQPAHDFLYWEFHENGGRQAVRQGRWKAVRLDAIAHPDNPVELYDLQNDPGEKKNLAAQHPDIAQRLSGLMAASHMESPLFPFHPRP